MSAIVVPFSIPEPSADRAEAQEANRGFRQMPPADRRHILQLMRAVVVANEARSRERAERRAQRSPGGAAS
jgi:hypothetical protein